MKRTALVLLIAITLQQTVTAQTNWPLYCGPGFPLDPLGYTNDQILLPNGKIAMINNGTVNAGSSTSQFFVVGTPDSQSVSPVTVSGIDFSDPTPPWNYFVDQAPGNQIIMTGFAKTIAGDRALLSYYNPTTNLVTPSGQFILTGNTNVKFNGTGIGSDSLRLCLEDNVSTTVNGMVVPPYGIIDICLGTGAVVLRSDLVLFDENGNPQPTLDVLLLSNGKRAHCGRGVKRSSPTGPQAQHGLIEDPTTGLITDLGFPGSGIIACKKMVEKNGYIYIAHDFLDHPGISNIFMKKNIATGLISQIPILPAYLTPYIRMSKVSDMIVTLEGMIVVVGSPLPFGTGTPIMRYNPYSGLSEDLNVGVTLFSNPNETSNVNSVVSYPSMYWGQTISLTGNFEFGTTGATASSCIHTAMNLTVGSPVAIKLTAFTGTTQNSNALVQWQTGGVTTRVTYELDRSSNGTEFIAVNLQVGDVRKKSFQYTDRSLMGGTYYYRLKMTDIDGTITYSPILLLKIGISKDEIMLYPNPVSKGNTLQIAVTGSPLKSYTWFNSQGQLVLKKGQLSMSGTITISTASLIAGTYYVRIVTENSITTQKLIVL